MAAAMRISALQLRNDSERVAAIMALRSHKRKTVAAQGKVIVFPPTDTYSGSNILARWLSFLSSPLINWVHPE